jgi:hypothetical protein
MNCTSVPNDALPSTSPTPTTPTTVVPAAAKCESSPTVAAAAESHEPGTVHCENVSGSAYGSEESQVSLGSIVPSAAKKKTRIKPDVFLNMSSTASSSTCSLNTAVSSTSTSSSTTNTTTTAMGSDDQPVSQRTVKGTEDQVVLRRMRNTESARRSRAKKLQRAEMLEETVVKLQTMNAELVETVQALRAQVDFLMKQKMES